MSLTINTQAPNFTLFNTEKKEISLSNYQGKNVVVLFFPLAFTGTCTTELCNIRDNYSVYKQLNAVVIGISVDSLFALAKYKEEQKLNFDLLSDFNKVVSKAYDCLYSQFIFGTEGVSKRSVFVIDKNGILKHSEILENATDLPSFTAIQDCLKGLD